MKLTLIKASQRSRSILQQTYIKIILIKAFQRSRTSLQQTYIKLMRKLKKYSQYFINILFMVQRPLTKLLARTIEIINSIIFNNIKYSFN
jgi:hypothetical protein